MAETVDTADRSASPVTLDWVAVGLVAITGVVHLYVGAVRTRPSLLVAGLGFVGGIALFLRGFRGRTLYLLGTAYVLVQIVLWLVLQMGEYTPIGIFDKVVQSLLVVVLVVRYRKTGKSGV